MGYLDALDGTRQAFTLPGGWSINLIVQQFVGLGSTGLPKFKAEFLGSIDAEGVSIIWMPALESVELKIAGGGPAVPDLLSDQLLVTESTPGLTGVRQFWLAGTNLPLGHASGSVRIRTNLSGI